MWLYKIALYKSIVFFQNRDDLNIFLERGLVESEYADVLPGSWYRPEKILSKKG